ncbi:MAG: CarD family transcriptional regulator [Bacteriovoracaceae bacterium]|nr:CarD family transcriptional regulator [Bacteriovoracaceae bacterium]
MFEIGEYAVCPGHGVGQICNIEERDVGDTKCAFYVIKVIANGMTVMVPVNSPNGVRSLISNEEIDNIYTFLSNHDVKLDTSTWNRRYRDYMAKITTGSLIEIADVLRSLFLLKAKKNLSFGEKKMLDQCQNLLTEEIALSGGDKPCEVKTQIESCFRQ